MRAIIPVKIFLYFFSSSFLSLHSSGSFNPCLLCHSLNLLLHLFSPTSSSSFHSFSLLSVFFLTSHLTFPSNQHCELFFLFSHSNQNRIICCCCLRAPQSPSKPLLILNHITITGSHSRSLSPRTASS